MSETINHPFEIDFLDHVAIRVSDMEVSVRWYERVLGLKKYQFDAWGTYPIFMMAGKTGIAIFLLMLMRQILILEKIVG